MDIPLLLPIIVSPVYLDERDGGGFVCSFLSSSDVIVIVDAGGDGSRINAPAEPARGSKTIIHSWRNRNRPFPLGFVSNARRLSQPDPKPSSLARHAGVSRKYVQATGGGENTPTRFSPIKFQSCRDPVPNSLQPADHFTSEWLSLIRPSSGVISGRCHGRFGLFWRVFDRPS